MGLDAVELVMEVEDRFNVQLPDAVCERIRTVADMAAAVIERLPRSSGICATASGFYRFRRNAVEVLGVPKSKIRSCTRLDELLPRAERKLWKLLRERDSRLPRLEVRPELQRVLLWTGGTFFLAWFASTAVLAGLKGASVVAPVAFMALAVAVWMYTRLWTHFAICFPANFVTVADVAKAISPIESFSGDAARRLIDQTRILDEVRRITAEQMGHPLERVRPESRFIEDLGIS